jgi:hypothetical protein
MTEEYSIGYSEGYQEGWNAAMDSIPPAKQQPAVPQGWKLVPVEPTPEMLEEFKRAYKDGDFWRERIHGAVCAMLAAAPEQKGNV